MRKLVVGVNGHEAAEVALRWAVDAVGPGGEVVAVHVSDDESAAASVLDELRRTAPSTVRVSHESGEIARALVERAATEDADAIVVGAHRRRPSQPRRIGRLLRRLADTADCPVIAALDDDSGPARLDQPIVVGIGHGVGTETAATWAAQLAETMDLPLWLVRATGTAPILGLDGWLNVVAYHIDPTQRTTWALEDLHEIAERAQNETDRDLVITSAAVGTRPDAALRDTSGHASLIVLGLHRSDLTGRDHLTRTHRHVLGHARCPVAIVPTRDR